MSAVRVSVIVPIFNEVDNLEPLHEELVDVLAAVPGAEVIYVDDGSTDGTHLRLRQVVEGESSETAAVTVITLRRNFGQTAALAAGADVATGEVIVFMDGDRQNDPHDIPRLLELIDEGNDVVSGWRRDRQDAFLSRRLPSIVANRMISLVTGVGLHDYGCTLKAYRADVMHGIQLYGEMHRFLPVFATLVGASVTEVTVNHRPRVAGRSKYGIGRTMKVLLDLLVVKFLSGYATKPIYVFGTAALASAAVGAVATLVSLYQRLIDVSFVHRNPLFYLGIFLGGLAMQFLLMGLIAEVGIRTYHESQGKPIYVVREVARNGPTASEPT